MPGPAFPAVQKKFSKFPPPARSASKQPLALRLVPQLIGAAEEVIFQMQLALFSSCKPCRMNLGQAVVGLFFPPARRVCWALFGSQRTLLSRKMSHRGSCSHVSRGPSATQILGRKYYKIYKICLWEENRKSSWAQDRENSLLKVMGRRAQLHIGLFYFYL